MNDLISRQAAIDAINQICPIDVECDGALLDRVDVRYVLTDLPSAQPERKKGQWRYYDGMCSCSVCNSHMDDISPFCPMCGADMMG